MVFWVKGSLYEFENKNFQFTNRSSITIFAEFTKLCATAICRRQYEIGDAVAYPQALERLLDQQGMTSLEKRDHVTSY